MKNIQVFFISNLEGNHYADLIIKNLNANGAEVEDFFPSIFFLSTILREGKPDILHLHTLHYFFLGKNNFNRFIKFVIFISQILILKLLGVKIVWTVHEWADRFGGGKYAIPESASLILGRVFEAIIAHCESTKNEVVKAFHLEGKNKVFVVLHGHYVGSYENKISQLEARKYLKISPENLVFLLFGNIHRTKGFLEGIEAFQRLQDNQISLLIVGNPAEDGIEELIKEKINQSKNIVFVPKIIPDDDIQIYMKACDCVMVPYKVFTTSGVTILSMSFAKACIAPKIGFFSDVLDDAGSFLYDSNQKDGLLQAMKKAIDKRDCLLDMGQHNLKIASQWTWDYVAEETLNIYQRCLNR
jgi:beta-1,4-mannosyltransferase